MVSPGCSTRSTPREDVGPRPRDRRPAMSGARVREVDAGQLDPRAGRVRGGQRDRLGGVAHGRSRVHDLKYRSVAALASSVIASSMPRRSTGLLTTAAVAKNATSAPTLSSPARGQETPNPSDTARIDLRDARRARTRRATASWPCAPRSAQLVGLVGEVVQRVGAPAERLEHADAVHGLLDRGGEVARLVPGAAGDELVVLAEPEAEPDHGHRADEVDSPSTQLVAIIRPMPTTTVVALTSSITRPNTVQRRMVPRSDMIRDSS